jgi:hypothetical protein
MSDNENSRLMSELAKGRTLEGAWARAGMHVQTGRKYRRLGRLPSECVRVAAVHEQPDLSDEPRLLVTNRSDWDAAKIVRLYGRRRAIERSYLPRRQAGRTAKHCLGLQECQLRRIAGLHYDSPRVVQHWCLVWLAQSLLPLCRAVGAPQKQARRCLRSVEALCQHGERHLLRDTVEWIWQAFSNARTPDDVYQTLAAA